MQIILPLVKAIVNVAAEGLLKGVPEVEPTYPDTMVLAARFDQLIRDAKGELGNTKDRNFLTLLKAVKRTLIYIAENDGYYHRWLMTAMGLFDGCYDDMDRVFNDSNVTGNYNKLVLWRRRNDTNL